MCMVSEISLPSGSRSPSASIDFNFFNLNTNSCVHFYRIEKIKNIISYISYCTPQREVVSRVNSGARGPRRALDQDVRGLLNERSAQT